jgi:hypothetical protein
MRIVAFGAASANRRVISAVSTGSRAVISPPPSATGTGWSPRPRRRSAATAITHTSSASRRTRSSATSSPAAAAWNRTEVSPSARSQPIVPVCRPTATSCMLAAPRWAQTPSRNAVAGPRPSSARLAQ